MREKECVCNLAEIYKYDIDFSNFKHDFEQFLIDLDEKDKR